MGATLYDFILLQQKKESLICFVELQDQVSLYRMKSPWSFIELSKITTSPIVVSLPGKIVLVDIALHPLINVIFQIH
jgi:hypothetical protein